MQPMIVDVGLCFGNTSKLPRKPTYHFFFAVVFVVRTFPLKRVAYTIFFGVDIEISSPFSSW